MFDRTGKYLLLAIMLGMVLGVVFVAIFGEAGLHVKFLGDIFLNALKMIVIPLLFCSMIVGISNLGDIRKLGRTGLKTLLYFLATSTIAVIIGLILVNIIRPGSGFIFSQTAVPDMIIANQSYSFLDWLSQQIPSNIFAAAAETQVLPIIIVALFFGGILTTIGSKGRPVIAIIEGINEALMKGVHIIMWFAPIGIFGLVAGQLAAVGGLNQSWAIISALGKYSLVVVIGLLIHGLIVLPLILRFMSGKSPLEYFTGMGQALITAFATSSSSATLPVTMECVEEKNDIDKRASSFVLPLGATINMDGTALYEAVAALFIAQAYGIALPIWSQVTVCVTAVLASIGAAGIPQAGLFTMVLVLQAVGLPLEGIGLILAVDWLLDRCRTTVNVWGDSVGAAVIASTSEIALVDKHSRSRTKQRFDRGGQSRQDDQESRQRSKFPLRSRDKKGGFGQRPEKTDRPARPEQTDRTDRTERPDRTGRSNRPGRFDRNQDRRRSGRPDADSESKVDRFASKQQTRQIHTIEVPSPSQSREEYRPESSKDEAPGKYSSDRPVPRGSTHDMKETGAAPMASPSGDTVSGDKPAASSPALGKDQQGRPDRSDTVFGRKQMNPARKRKPRKSDDDMLQDKAEEAKEQKSGVNASFEIPKFPKSILEDLAAPASGSAAGIVAKTGSDDSAVRPKYRMAKKTPGSDEIEVPSSTSDPETSLGESSENGKTSETDDFSKLDRAIFGGAKSASLNASEQRDAKTVQPETDTISDGTSDAPSRSAEYRRASGPPKSDYSGDTDFASSIRPRIDSEVETAEQKKHYQTTPAGSSSGNSPDSEPSESSSGDSKPEMVGVRESSMADSEESSIDTPATKASNDADESEPKSDRDQGRASSAGSKPATEKEDDDESSGWGRTKQRRPSR